MLRPDVLNLDTIFDKVLLALNDSISIAERLPNGDIQYECHSSFWIKLGFTEPFPSEKWMHQIEAKEQAGYQAKLNSFYLSQEPAFTTHVPILNSKGETLWYLVQVVRLGDAEALKQSFLFMLKDVSIKRRENILLKEAQRIIGMGFWEWDVLSDNMYWSEITKEIHEVEKDFKPTLDSVSQFYKELETREKIKEVFKQALESGESYNVELNLTTAKGNDLWIESRGKADIENGKVIRVYGTVVNVTSKKRIEDKLRVNEESFRGSFEHAAIGMAVVGPKGEWIKVNKSLTEIVGYTYEELTNLTFQDITHPEDLDMDLNLLKKLIAGEIDSYQIEKRYIHKKGHEVWIILSVSIVHDEGGKPLYFVSQITDINDRKITQQQLMEAHSEIQGIIDASTHVSIIATDTEGTIQQFNKGAENILGYKAEEMIGKKTPIVFHKREEVIERGKELSEMFNEKIEGFDTFIYLAKTGKFDSREWTYIRKDGEGLPVQLVVTARKDGNGEIVGYLGIATDIRDRKHTEELERQMAILQSKSEEMEQFAYITSHDLREPLLTITNYVKLLNAEFKDNLDTNALQFFGYISGAADRLNSLINGLLQYSRLSNTPMKTPVNLENTIDEVKANLRGKIEETRAEITAIGLPVVMGYEKHLYILFQNLIQNAIKFVEEGAIPKIKIVAEKRNKDIRIEVIDNGIGIEKKYNQKIFTIFQRLHDHGAYEGNGMGLALAKKIVELHNGMISVENNENGEGCKFIVLLPIQ